MFRPMGRWQVANSSMQVYPAGHGGCQVGFARPATDAIRGPLTLSEPAKETDSPTGAVVSYRFPATSTLHTAARMDDLAGNPVRIVRNKKSNQPRCILRRANPAHGGFRLPLLLQFRGNPACIRGPGIDGVYGYSEPANFSAQAPAEGFNGSFRSCICQFTRHGTQSLSRG